MNNFISISVPFIGQCVFVSRSIKNDLIKKCAASLPQSSEKYCISFIGMSPGLLGRLILTLRLFLTDVKVNA